MRHPGKRLTFLLVLWWPGVAQGVDFTFAVWSDTHFGANDDAGYRDNAAQDIVNLPGTPYPPQIGGAVGPMAFVLVTGDITESTLFTQYQDSDGQSNDDFISCIDRWFTVPVYEITGNHDSYNEPGATQIRSAITARHGATSYSFNHEGVHFVGLDGWTSSNPQPLHESAVVYLETYMPTLGRQQPVVIFNHFPPSGPPHPVW